jgi:hypothetical protein
MFRDEVLSASGRLDGHLDRRELTRRFEEHQTGRAAHDYTLWAVWVLERWLESGATAG